MEPEPSIIALVAAEELFRVLTEENGVTPFDAIAAMHGEIVRQMVVHFGFAETETRLATTLSTIIELAEAEAADPSQSLLQATPAGSA